MELRDAFAAAFGNIEQKSDDRIDYEFKSLPGDKAPKAEPEAEKTLLGSPRVTSMELSDIGQKYGVDLSMLRGAAEMAESPVDDLTAGIPSWIYKKLQDEGGEAAIEEIDRLVAEKQTGAEQIVRGLIPSPESKIQMGSKVGKAVSKIADELVDVPGLELKKIKKYGQELWETWVAGKKIGQSQGEQGARSKALEWKKKNPDKLEQLIIKADETGR